MCKLERGGAPGHGIYRHQTRCTKNSSSTGYFRPAIDRCCISIFNDSVLQVTVGIQGRAVGCSVRLEKKEDPFARGCGVPDSMNFREVQVGASTSRMVYLYNQSSAPCRFCFDVQVKLDPSPFTAATKHIPH